MRLSDLHGKTVRSLDGKKLGRIHDVHCKGGRVTALMCGPASMIERWTARTKGHRVPWKEVRRIERDAIIISDRGTQSRR